MNQFIFIGKKFLNSYFIHRYNNLAFDLNRVPINDTRRTQWFGALKEHNNADVSMQQNICELHFTKNDFTASRKLKTNAFPTVFPNRYTTNTISIYSLI